MAMHREAVHQGVEMVSALKKRSEVPDRLERAKQTTEYIRSHCKTDEPLWYKRESVL